MMHEAAPSPSAPKRWRPRPTAARAGVIVAALAVLEVLSRAGVIDPLFFSPPTAVAAKIVQLFADHQIAAAYALAAYQVVMAFVLAGAFGIPAGVLIGAGGGIYRRVHPIMLMLFGIPQITMVSLVVLAFGAGNAAKIAFGFSHAIIPIMLATVGATRSVDRRLVDAAVSMGATPRLILFKVMLPSIWPAMITGLRLGVSQALLGVLLAELWVSHNDIGYYVTLYTSSFKPAETYAIVTTIAGAAIIASELMRAAERHFGRWRG